MRTTQRIREDEPTGTASNVLPAGVEMFDLQDMVGGWFVGAFSPAALSCAGAEVGVKDYRAGDTEPVHEHRIATEVTLILRGRAVMCDREVGAGEIVVLAPGTATGFLALTDVTTVVVKTPSVLGDKYILEEGVNRD